MPDDLAILGRTFSEAEFVTYLHGGWRAGHRMPPEMASLLRAYVLRRLRSWLSRQDELVGLSQDAARMLCRAYIDRAVAEFTAWTPLALPAAA
jgi:hypothetical protein